MQRMTEEEIKRDLRLSVNKDKQVRILADINATTPKIINRIINGQTWEEAEERRGWKSRYKPKGAWKAWTYDEIKKVQELYCKKYSHKEIASEVGRSVGAIYGIRRRYPDFFPKPTPYRRFTDEEIDRICALHSEGYNIAQIAGKIGRGKVSVRTVMKRKKLI